MAPAAPGERPRPRVAPPTLDRARLFRDLPRHLLVAVICGALAAPLLYSLNAIPLEGAWRWVLAPFLLIVYSLGVVVPLVSPGRHWTLGLFTAVMQSMLVIPALILAARYRFPHSVLNGDAVTLVLVNQFTAVTLATGLALGFFYGVLSGRPGALLIGGVFGAAGGYLLGAFSIDFVGWRTEPGMAAMPQTETWRYDGPLHMIWQGALALAWLHLCALAGAALGAGREDVVEKTS